MIPTTSHLATTINWGDFPTWVSAIGTVGALLLGFIIIGRDRYVARHMPANSLISFINTVAEVDIGDNITGYRTTVSIYNAGFAPIFQSTLFSNENRYAIPLVETQNVSRSLAPGKDHKWIYQFKDDPRARPYILYFVDSANKRWRRDVRTNKYMSHKKMLRIMGQVDEMTKPRT
jgi:hypothetical protein